MRRFRQPRLSDEQADRLLSPDDSPVEAAAPLTALTSELREAGRTPPSDAVTGRHLAAILAEVRGTRHADVAPAPRPSRRVGAHGFGGLLVPRRLTAAAAAFTAMIVLATAGALPGPVQAAASDVLAAVGIAVPDGDSTTEPQDNAPAPRVERRERSVPRSMQAPAVTGEPGQRIRGDRRERPRRTPSPGAVDAGDRQKSDRPASVPADRRDDDRRDARRDGSDDDAERTPDRVNDETEATGSDDDERPSRPETQVDPGSGEATDDPTGEKSDDRAGAGAIDAGDAAALLEKQRSDTAGRHSADETPSEGD